MVPWTTLVDELTAYLTDAAHPVMLDEVRASARDYFELSRVWRAASVSFGSTVALQSAYTFTPPADTDMVGLPAIWVGGREVGEMVPGDSDDIEPGEVGTAKLARVIARDTLQLLPTPVAGGQAIVATVAYAPGSGASGLDDDLYRRHREPIIHRALSRMFRHKARPYYDPRESARHESLYLALALDRSSDAGPIRRNRLRVKPSPV